MKLKVENVSVGHSPNNIVFKNISFELYQNRIAALLGINGIGKSTLIKTLCGLQKKLSGNIFYDHSEVQELPVHERAKLISFVSTERLMIENISVHGLLTLGRFVYTNWTNRMADTDNELIEKVIQLLQLSDLKHREFNRLSDGEKQKVLIGRALCQNTPVIILDEPTAFLDFKNREKIFELLHTISREMNKLVLFSTHDIASAIQVCDELLLMRECKNFEQVVNRGLNEENVKRALVD